MSNTPFETEAVSREFELPSMPSTAAELLSVLNSSDPDIDAVIRLIECEPVIASKVIQLVNSPLYAVARPITSIGHGIVILGFDTVSQLSLAIATQDLFAAGDKPCPSARQATYEQSLGVATVARLLADQMGTVAPDEAFLCGVLHEVGKLVLFTSYGEQYEQLLNQLDTIDSTPFEKKQLGVSHPELGWECCRTWELPASLSTGVKTHHMPLNHDGLDALSKNTIIASQIAAYFGYGFSKPFGNIDHEVVGELGPLDLVELNEQCDDQFAAIREICGVRS